MPLYSSSTRKPNQMGPVHDKQIPFVAHFAVVPDTGFGRRMEYYRALETIAVKAETALLDATFNIATPVAWTPQMGQAPARLTVVGFAGEEDLLGGTTGDPAVDAPVNPGVEIIHSGTVDGEQTEVKTPPQGTQTWGDTPSDTNQSYVVTLKSALETTTGLTVTYLELNGVKYGQIPNRKGFFSFPD